jgi:DnaK suppressor protein
MDKQRNSAAASNRTKATAAQILGGGRNGAENAKVSAKWKEQFERLLEMRAQILQRKGNLADTAREEQPAFSLHMADAGTDEFDRDFALSLMSSDQEALYELDQAISRIRNGTYGICELTGATIEPERLAAIPWARFSMDAQRELELTGAVHRTQFGKRGSLTTSEASDEDTEEETPAPSERT